KKNVTPGLVGGHDVANLLPAKQIPLKSQRPTGHPFGHPLGCPAGPADLLFGNPPLTRPNASRAEQPGPCSSQQPCSSRGGRDERRVQDSGLFAFKQRERRLPPVPRGGPCHSAVLASFRRWPRCSWTRAPSSARPHRRT